jgi:hypothetical protein
MSWYDYAAEDEAAKQEFLKTIPVPAKTLRDAQRRAMVRQSITGYCDSPLEVDLAVQLIDQIGVLKDLKFAFCKQGDIANFQDLQLLLIPQFRWRRFRMDFALMFEAAIPYVFVECDSKQWHSTAAQIENDRRKDAEAASAEIPLLRFTSVEIFSWRAPITERIWNAVLEQVARK